MNNVKELDDITGAVVDAALKIHKDLGPGLLESVYEVVLARELDRRGFKVERQKPIRFEYDGMVFEEGFRTDLLVESRVVVELKSVEDIASVHSKQLLTYLRLMHLPVGLLINFGAATFKEGLRRIVNNLPPSAPPREPIFFTWSRRECTGVNGVQDCPPPAGSALRAPSFALPLWSSLLPFVPTSLRPSVPFSLNMVVPPFFRLPRTDPKHPDNPDNIYQSICRQGIKNRQKWSGRCQKPIKTDQKRSKTIKNLLPILTFCRKTALALAPRGFLPLRNRKNARFRPPVYTIV